MLDGSAAIPLCLIRSLHSCKTRTVGNLFPVISLHKLIDLSLPPGMQAHHLSIHGTTCKHPIP